MATLLRTIVVDSAEESRRNLQQMLAGTQSVIVGEFATIPEALRTAPAYRPDVLIAEVPLDAGSANGASSAIEHLARVLPDTAIIVTGPTQSAQLVIQVMRAGALDYVARPVRQEDLKAALEKVSRARPKSGAEREVGQVISIFSPKGGTGVTTVATNLAVCWAKRSPGRTILVDLDTRQSDVASFLNLRPQYSVFDAFENIGRMDESFLRRLLIEHASGLFVLPGAAPMNRNKLRREQVHAGVEILRSYFDQVVLDLPHDLENGTAAALEASDLVFFVTSPNVSALRLTTAAIAALRHTGFNLKKIRLVLMRSSAGEDIPSRQAREMLGLDIYWTLPHDDVTVLKAINKGEPFVMGTPRSKIAKSLRDLSGTLAEEASSDASDKPFTLLGWSLGRIS